MTEELGVSAEKIKVFSDYLDRVQKVADTAGIELEEVLGSILFIVKLLKKIISYLLFNLIIISF